MKKWKQLVLSFALLVGASAAFVPATPVSAINVFEQCGGNSGSDVCKAQGTDNATSMIEIVINTLLFILGSISVIMIVIGGIRYTTSAGVAADTKAAKDTIMYALVGLVVAMLSYTIVNFVVGRFI